jgi:hypothetical protein
MYRDKFSIVVIARFSGIDFHHFHACHAKVSLNEGRRWAESDEYKNILRILLILSTKKSAVNLIQAKLKRDCVEVD